jgi:hypothetical protein
VGMMNEIIKLFSLPNASPHGYCLLWKTDLIALHAVSNILIAASYFLMPFVILLFLKKRPDIKHRFLFVLFALFILACGITHTLNAVTIWYPAYYLSGIMMAFTAAVSVFSAIVVAYYFPRLVSLRLRNKRGQILLIKGIFMLASLTLCYDFIFGRRIKSCEPPSISMTNY